jgi:hypothetical protein
VRLIVHAAHRSAARQDLWGSRGTAYDSGALKSTILQLDVIGGLVLDTAEGFVVDCWQGISDEGRSKSRRANRSYRGKHGGSCTRDRWL